MTKGFHERNRSKCMGHEQNPTSEAKQEKSGDTHLESRMQATGRSAAVGIWLGGRRAPSGPRNRLERVQ